MLQLPLSPQRYVQHSRCSKLNPPHFYGVPKIYKPNAPLRPIVNPIDLPTYNVAECLQKVLGK